MLYTYRHPTALEMSFKSRPPHYLLLSKTLLNRLPRIGGAMPRGAVENPVTSRARAISRSKSSVRVQPNACRERSNLQRPFTNNAASSQHARAIRTSRVAEIARFSDTPKQDSVSPSVSACDKVRWRTGIFKPGRKEWGSSVGGTSRGCAFEVFQNMFRASPWEAAIVQ